MKANSNVSPRPAPLARHADNQRTKTHVGFGLHIFCARVPAPLLVPRAPPATSRSTSMCTLPDSTAGMLNGGATRCADNSAARACFRIKASGRLGNGSGRWQ